MKYRSRLVPFFVLAIMSLTSLRDAFAADSGRPVASPLVPLDTEALLKRMKGLKGGHYGQTLEQAVRELKEPAGQRAVCLYILALVEGDVPAFMTLVPAQGVDWRKDFYDAKPVRKKLSKAEVEKRSLPAQPGGRPEFVGLFGDVSSIPPRQIDWNLSENRGRIQVAANGAFACAYLSKTKDGSYLISKIDISINND
jgi:hypothetical protein